MTDHLASASTVAACTAGRGGFRAAGVTAGLKSSGQPDVAVVVNDGPRFAAAGVFTANRVKAAPVRWCEQHPGPARAPNSPRWC